MTPAKSETCVSGDASLFRMGNRGARKPENFTREQIEAIRSALRDWQKRHPELNSQKKMADFFMAKSDITIGQQVMGLYLDTEKRAGMTNRVATAIVRKMGFESTHHFFEAHGLEHGHQEAMSTGDAELDTAVRLARLLGVDEDVIQYVVRQHKNGELRVRKAKYIVTHMVELERFKLEEREPDLRKPPMVTPIITPKDGKADGQPPKKPKK